MKKVLSFVVVLVLVLSFTFALAACHKTDKGGNDEGGGSTTPTITQDDVNDFIEMIEEYNLKSRTVVAADFDVPAKMDYLDVDFNIEWTITGGNGLATIVDKNETTKTVKINKYADEETTFTLTAKASYNGLEAQVSKELTIEQYVIASWDFWAEKTKDETMNIKGVVVGKYPYSDSYKNTSVYLQDLDGVHGYFAYRLKVASQEAYDTELAIGNIIEVNGKTSIYNDFREMGAGCTYSVVKNEDGSIATATPAVVNFDQVITESGKNAVAALDSYQGVIGTLSDYKVKTVEWYKGDATLPEGRLSVIFHAFKGDDELLVQFDTDYQATRDDVIAAVGKIQQGFVITVEAPLAWNKGPQMYPQVDKVTVTSTEVSAADKLATELAAIGFDANVKEAKSFDLAAKGATYEDVAFTWSLSESNVAAIADGKLNVTPVEGEVHSITVSLAATCGSETASKSFDIVVGDPSALTPAQIVAMAYALGQGKSMGFEVTLTGVVSEIVTPYDAGYGNISVNLIIDGDEEHIIQAFRLKGEGDNNVATLGEGDTVTVKGMIKNYKGTVEFDAGCLATAIERFERTDAQKIEEVLAILELPASVKESTTIDLPAKGSLYEEVELSWELLTETEQAAIENGKLNLTVEAAVTTIQVKVTATIGEGETAASDSKTFKIVLGDGSTLTPEQIVDMAFALGADKKLGFDVELTGIVTEIVEAYDPAGYGNITAWFVVEGRFENRIEIYRVKPVEGLDLSDVKVGDKLTVKGDIVNFRGNTVEFSQNDAKVIAHEEGTLPAYFDAKAEANAVELPSTIDEAFEQELPTIGSTDTEVSFQWVLTADPDAPVSIEEGILNVQPTDEDYTFELALHATKGNDEFVRTFNITVSATQMSAEEKLLRELYSLAVGETKENVELTGKVVSVEEPYGDYKNVSFTMVVGEFDQYPIVAYRVKGAENVDISGLDVGDVVTVKGTVVNFNQSVKDADGNYVLDDQGNKTYKEVIEFNNTSLVTALTVGERPDEIKAQRDAEAVSIETTFDHEQSIELPHEGTLNGSTFEWALEAGSSSNLDGFILNIVPGTEDETLTLTLTASLNGKTFEREFTLTVSSHQVTDEDLVNAIYTELADAANNKFTANSYTLTGVVTSVEKAYNSEDQYPEVTLWIQVGTLSDKLLEVYQGKKAEAVDGDLLGTVAKGDVVTVSGYLKKYNTTIEFAKNGSTNATVEAFEKTDLGRANYELSKLAFGPYDEAANVELAVNGSKFVEVALSYALDSEDYAVILDEEHVMMVAPGEVDGSVTLTVTASIGEVEATREITFKVTHPLTEEEIVANIFEEIGTAASGTWYGGSNPTLVQLTGTVSSILYAFSESNRTITLFVDVAGDRNMEAYKAVVDEALDGKMIAVGDEIIVSGYVKNYTKNSDVTIEWDTYSGVAPQIIGHEVSDANKVALEKAALSITTEYTEDINEVPLPSVGSLFEEDVTISWALAEESDNTLLEDNALIAFVVEETYTFGVVATISAGETTDTKSFTITMIGSASAKINAAKDALTLEQVDFTESTTEPIALPAEDEANGVTITWSLGESTAIVLADNNLSVTIADDTDETVTLTALFTCGAVQDTKEFTLTAKGANASAGGGSEETVREGSIDFTAQGYANQQAIESASINEGEITISFSKGSNNNPPKFYTSGTAIRCYGGNTFTLTAANGYVIKSITLTFGGSDGSNAITADVGTLDGAAWTDEAGQAAVVFTIGGTSGNRRLTGIAVTYEKASA